MPVELLREVNACVEIPQLGESVVGLPSVTPMLTQEFTGVLRSLNVHVSGAIMAWSNSKASRDAASKTC